jgi:hypothetical protein
VVNTTERCQAAAKVRKVAAKFQALAVIPRLQALFLFVVFFWHALAMDRGSIKIRTCVRFFTILLDPLRV